MALHEMWEVSTLPIGSLPYEKYFPYEAELALGEAGARPVRDLLKADVPLIHLLGHAWQPQGSFEQFKKLGELSVFQPGGCP